MAETILIPGKDNSSSTGQATISNDGYLLKDNLLSEFETDSDKSVARYNLGVLSAEDTYTKEDIDQVIIQKVSAKLKEHLDTSDHITEEDIFNMLTNLVKNDGTTPFTAPQAGVNPVSNYDLATKIYVDRLIKGCLKDSDKTNILEQIEEILVNYAKQRDVYTTEQVYTKEEIDRKNEVYVKSDGSTPFDKPQSGRTPQISSHLTTKGYVDNLLESHKQDIDPHGFIEKLNNKLKKYTLKDNVYDKSQVYSRVQIDEIVDRLVLSSVKEALRTHTDLDDPHGIIKKVKELGYIHKNGSVPFKAPQKGVDAVDPQDLVTLKQVEKFKTALQQEINSKECEWITSGPSGVTVGNVEVNQELPATMNLQEIMDAIFYGKGITLIVPAYTNITNSCKVKACIQGSLGMVEYAELFQDGKLVESFDKEMFEFDRCITFESDPIVKDTEFTFRVTYVNGAVHEETKITKCSIPIFIGLLPKWKFGNTVTYQYLMELAEEDKINNKFYSESKEVTSITHQYNFTDKDLKHLFVVVPKDYPDLVKVQIPSQQFDIEAFDVIDMIPLQIPGTTKDTIYKMYIYRQAISSANQETTFKFGKV